MKIKITIIDIAIINIESILYIIIKLINNIFLFYYF